MVQWLRLCTPNARGPGFISGQEARSDMPQLKDAASCSWDLVETENFFLKYWEAIKLLVANTSFPIFFFFFSLYSSNFILGNKYCQLFFLKWQFTSFILKKMSAKYPYLNNHSFRLLAILSDGVPWQKCPVELTTQNNWTSAFPQDNHHNSVCSSSTSYLRRDLHWRVEI